MVWFCSLTRRWRLYTSANAVTIEKSRFLTEPRFVMTTTATHGSKRRLIGVKPILDPFLGCLQYLRCKVRIISEQVRGSERMTPPKLDPTTVRNLPPA